MAKSRNWNDLYKQLFQSLADDAATGRRMLVVLGSGCSASLGLPTMRLIFKWLHSQLIKMLEEPRYVDAKKARAIRALSEDLETMNNGGGSRAVAARALRLLQHAPLRSDLERFERKEKTPDTSATEVCRDLWRSFGVAFLNCEIREANAASNQTEPLPLKQPTHFHKFIADLVKLDRAIPLSLNFDGLTRKAINQALASEVKAPPCVILSSPETIRGFFCASPSGTSPTKFVVKVWGDVFHAVCQTPSCPQFGREVPLYDIGNTETGSIPRARPSSDIVENRAAQSPKGLFDERTPQVNVPSESSGQPLLTSAELLRCPDCHGDRQLQVFFAGYHEKERRTEELISALETFISPTIGSLLIAGFSGNWDSSLVEYLVALAREVDRRKGSTSKVFCIDQDETTHIRRLIKAENVVIIPETEMGCEEFADSADQYRR